MYGTAIIEAIVNPGPRSWQTNFRLWGWKQTLLPRLWYHRYTTLIYISVIVIDTSLIRTFFSSYSGYSESRYFCGGEDCLIVCLCTTCVNRVYWRNFEQELWDLVIWNSRIHPSNFVESLRPHDQYVYLFQLCQSRIVYSISGVLMRTRHIAIKVCNLTVW